MNPNTADRKINTRTPVHNDGGKRLPHERDESPEGQNKPTRGVMRQAADDLAQGLVDTDLHGTPGAEAAVAGGGGGQAKPHADAAHGMRDAAATPSTSSKDKA